jgi:hypothetical protein
MSTSRIWPAAGRLGVIAIAGLILVAACSKKQVYRPTFANRPPAITELSLSPTLAHPHQSVRVRAQVVDPDGDPLQYLWTASKGTLPDGRATSSVRWLTPPDLIRAYLIVAVSDYAHTVKDTLAVDLVAVRPPDSLTFVDGASSVRLTWRPSPDEGMDDWQGYEIFRATHNFMNVPIDSLYAYKITPQPINAQTYRISGLQAGTRYWFRVASKRNWEGHAERSTLTDSVETAPRPEGILSLRELQSPAGGLALDLSAGQARPLDPGDISALTQRDLYVGTADSLDRDAPLVLKSVSRLRNRNPAWSGRQVLLKPAGTNWDINTVDDTGWLEETPLQLDQVYAVLLPEGNYGKIQITDVQGYAPYRYAVIHWAYQPIPGYPVF